jgi:hypothetical protein
MKWTHIPLALLISALVAPMAAEAQRRASQPGHAATRQQTKETRKAQKAQLKADLATAKTRVKQGKPYLQRQAQLVKQTTRNVLRLQQPRVEGRARVEAAFQSYRANPTAQNAAFWRSTYADYKPMRDAHESALTLQRQAISGLDRMKGQQQKAVSTLVDAQAAVKRGPPKVRSTSLCAGRLWSVGACAQACGLCRLCTGSQPVTRGPGCTPCTLGHVRTRCIRDAAPGYHQQLSGRG